MEAEGAVCNVLGIFNKGEAFVGEVVADNNSLTWVLLKHSHRDKKRKAEEMGQNYKLPRYEKGGLKPDHSKLPLDHPEPVFQSQIAK